MEQTATPTTVVLGAGGMLGRQWASALASEIRSGAARALTRAECNILDKDALATAIPESAELVINCAAYTNVDGAESEEDLAFAVNGFAVGDVANRCGEIGATLVHYSTDYVFRGDASEPYRVDSPRNPLGAYGRSKALGEELLEASGASHLIVRTSWLYARHGANFVRTILGLADERDTLRVVDDQRGRPASVTQLVDVTQRLVEAGARGTFHGADAGECTWFEFAQEIVRLSGASCAVEPCASDEFPRPAARPAYSVLDLSRTEQLVGGLTHWSDALAKTLGETTLHSTERQGGN